jgi:transposase
MRQEADGMKKTRFCGEAYVRSLRMIFSMNTHEGAARLSLAKWYDRAGMFGFKSLQAIISTLTEYHDGVQDFFVSRSTNAFAECFNAKIKQFRVLLRGGY